MFWMYRAERDLPCTVFSVRNLPIIVRMSAGVRALGLREPR
jgi:hypothetical protein